MVDQIKEIHKIHSPELTQWQIAEKFKITQGTIIYDYQRKKLAQYLRGIL